MDFKTPQTDQPIPSPDISVVCCTYNRAEILRRALQSLVEQTLSPDRYEVIVVDNGSTDHTHQLVEEFTPGPALMRYVPEPRLGLGIARATGVEHACGRWVAFMDDDAAASPDWLEQCLRLAETVSPAPWVLGGVILPYYDAPKPDWFKDRYEIRTWGDEPRFLRMGEVFSGSNMIFRRDLAEKYVGFGVGRGMTGENFGAGEDGALLDGIWADHGAQTPVYYSPELKVYHRVPAEKMHARYKLKRAFMFGQYQYRYHGARSFGGRLLELPRYLGQVVRLTLVALVQLPGSRNLNNWVFESLRPVFRSFGKLTACLGIEAQMRHRQKDEG